MDSANDQKILGYFIEEAKEHLETLEQGILDLGNLVNNNEQMNGMFRAAHSVKAGAAMLGYSSIQKTAHRLEDAFTILKENPLEVDQKLESLLLKSYDLLQILIDKLQSPLGLQAEEADAIIKNGEATFAELQAHLNYLLGRGKSTPAIAAASSISISVRDILKQMLQLFKQEETSASRQQLQKLILSLSQLASEQQQWQYLVKNAQSALANPKHSYRTLAPVIIRELKQAGDLLEWGRGEEITVSQELQLLAAAKLPQILINPEAELVASTPELLPDQDLEEALTWSQNQDLNGSEKPSLELSQIPGRRKAQIASQREAYQLAEEKLTPEFEENQRATLIEETLAWTGGNLELTEIVIRLLIDNKNELREGQEKPRIEQLIQKHIVENWLQNKAAVHLQTIQNSLLNSDANVRSRLETYQDILQGRVLANNKPEKLDLQQAELVIKNGDYLEVTNRIYQEVFNVQWIKQELEKLVNVENSPANLTKILSFLALLAFLGFTFWSLKTPENAPNVMAPPPEICDKRDFNISLEKNIQQLQELKRKQGNQFSDKCGTQLNELMLIQQAIGLAADNFVANVPGREGGFEILCKIPPTSHNFKDAQYWAKRWYNDRAWKSDIDRALQDNPDCQKLIK
ncbi:High-affnity carbon uptake protein Hat/HatR [Microcystis aeruginosa NIES-2549]|uniref:High-affnity carbon uptake protein Hat/HatR n=1 Tax=Microcystis aeruginosa NIES-2549 TaxID=1641812 RepID=A0A0F6U2M4_MICAE|nr:Hpt domain-containing protein [Microcystis aeruginosa]AKE63429.1 High-affnity carbon uptake protein Hat/HatR [Microcystis aeruginosa NIES-2549]AOC51821.1 High-affnity carbon uptake protein Hat/HatR [Microcystis aeruginosa NIES-2481]